MLLSVYRVLCLSPSKTQREYQSSDTEIQVLATHYLCDLDNLISLCLWHVYVYVVPRLSVSTCNVSC